MAILVEDAQLMQQRAIVEIADQVEATIDGQVRDWLAGGGNVEDGFYPAIFLPNLDVREEVQRRYEAAGWKVTWNSGHYSDSVFLRPHYADSVFLRPTKTVEYEEALERLDNP